MPHRILVVDDDAAFLELAAEVLRSHGYVVLEARSIAEATTLVRSSRFDVVVSDVWLGGGSGFALAATLALESPTTRAVMITGFPTADMLDRAAELGACVLAKPFLPEHLLAAVRAVLPSRGKKVLVAEDDVEMRALLADVLRADGIDVVEAADGRELFWLLERAAHDVPVDLVISDVRMPTYDALEVLEAWKVDERPRILLMTAFPDPAVRERAARMGIDVFDKPLGIDRLRAQISAALEAVG